MELRTLKYFLTVAREENFTRAAELLHHYYEIVWDEEQTHKFKNISPHLQRIKAFKTLG